MLTALRGDHGDIGSNTLYSFRPRSVGDDPFDFAQDRRWMRLTHGVVFNERRIQCRPAIKKRGILEHGRTLTARGLGIYIDTRRGQVLPYRLEGASVGPHNHGDRPYGADAVPVTAPVFRAAGSILRPASPDYRAGAIQTPERSRSAGQRGHANVPLHHETHRGCRSRVP